MNSFYMLTKRNTKLFFKDKGMFFCSLITPLILLVLYVTFLGNAFKQTFVSVLPSELNISQNIIDGLAGGQLFASLLAVCCVTVAFCANMLMVQDKYTGARKDLLITQLKKSKLALSYYVATFVCTFIICIVATLACFIYLAVVGWYMSFLDCLIIFFDVLLLTLFGTVLSSLVNYFLNTQGQVSAVSGIVSSMYGFICGAYMPMATFGKGLQNALMFLPSAYATSLVKRHCLRGALVEFQNYGIPAQAIKELKSGLDCSLSFFGNNVSLFTYYLILIGTISITLLVYVLLNKFKIKNKNK
ncbi:MAG: ABC transporter permease [Clostridia bacterium]|nr:ABC transporter permease [Clostridia bacterium]